MYERGQRKAAERSRTPRRETGSADRPPDAASSRGRRRRGHRRKGPGALKRARPALFAALLVSGGGRGGRRGPRQDPQARARGPAPHQEAVHAERRWPSTTSRRSSFFVRDSDPHASVQIVGPDNQAIRTLYRGPLVAYKHVAFTWNGRTSKGNSRTRHEGYRLRVILPDQDRDMVYPTRSAAGEGPMTASALEFAAFLVACGAAATALLAPDPRLRYGCRHSGPGGGAGPGPWQRLGHVTGRLAAPSSGEARRARGRRGGGGRGSRGGLPPLRVELPPRGVRRPAAPGSGDGGGQTSHLLVPLYVVIAAGVLCFAYAAIRGPRARDDGAPPAHPGDARDIPAHPLALPRFGGDRAALRDPVLRIRRTSRTPSRTRPSSWCRSRCCSCCSARFAGATACWAGS